MICNKCGNQIPAGQSFCNMCGTPVTPNQSGGNKKTVQIVVIGALVLVVIILGVIAILPSGNKNLKDDKTTTTVDSKTLNESTTTTTTTSKSINIDNIDINNLRVAPDDNTTKTQKIEFINAIYNKNASSNKLQLLFKNNNDFLASGTVYLNYYQNGTRIGSNSDGFSLVNPGSRFIVTINPQFNEPYDSIDVTYSAYNKVVSYVQIPLNTSEINIRETKEYNGPTLIECTFTHNLDKKATYYLGIIYKKNGKDVGYASAINSETVEKKGETGIVKFRPNLTGLEDYDEYEVFVQSSNIQDENF